MNSRLSLLTKSLVTQILVDNQVRRGHLAHKLDYGSTTSIDRLANANTKERAIADFIGRIDNSDLLLSSASLAIINQIKTILYRVDSTDWLQFFTHASETMSPFMLFAKTDGKSVSLSSHLSHFESVEMFLIGCMSKSLFYDIAASQSRTKLTVSHLMPFSQDETTILSQLSTIFPLIFFPGYQCFTYGQKDGSLENTVFSNNCALIIGKREGSDRDIGELLLPKDGSSGMLLPVGNPRDLLTAFRNSFTARNLKKFNNAEVVFFDSDYISYLNYLRTLEYKHSVYRMKPDIGIELVPFEIQALASREGPIGHDPEMASTLTEMLEIQKKRYTSSRSNKHQQIHLLKYSSMMKFMDSGMLHDHFWGMRAFTPQERRQILEDLIARQEPNNAFSIRFLKEESCFDNHETIAYDDDALCMIQDGTNYDLAKTHSETILKDPLLCRSFIHFFRDELMAKCSYSHKESLEMLNRLLSQVSDE